MNIASVASALPKHTYPQEFLLQQFLAHWGQRVDNPQFLSRLHGRVGVDTRSLALPVEEYPGLKSFGKANDHWISVGLELGEECLTAALNRAQLPVSRIGAFFFTSITGISAPSL